MIARMNAVQLQDDPSAPRPAQPPLSTRAIAAFGVSACACACVCVCVCHVCACERACARTRASCIGLGYGMGVNGGSRLEARGTFAKASLATQPRERALGEASRGGCERVKSGEGNRNIATQRVTVGCTLWFVCSVHELPSIGRHVGRASASEHRTRLGATDVSHRLVRSAISVRCVPTHL